jgi:hypothetical protein
MRQPGEGWSEVIRPVGPVDNMAGKISKLARESR